MRVPAFLLVLGALAPAFAADWIAFEDETASRLAVPSPLGANDPDEKSYAWGDLDQDGDVDLVVVRKAPFVSAGGRPSLLLLNENGVLTDRTAALATASDVPGDMGLATPTCSRDVAVVDVDLDGWLDVVTVATFSQAAAKHIGHPRAYLNRGCGGPCGSSAPWLGLRYEDARIPALLTYAGAAGKSPNFGSVSTGDVTGDGYPDLWFSELEPEGPGVPPNVDFNDRLLVNQGASHPGFFSDMTSALVGDFDLPGSQNVLFEASAFSSSGAIGDFNGDGALDILKVNAGLQPTYVAVAINSPAPGVFAQYRPVQASSVYAVSAADLDRDGRLDIIETDDGQDRYLINLGNGTGGLPSFASYPFTYAHSGAGPDSDDVGFGGTSRTADLDRDGWLDVLIPDIDVNLGDCSGRLAIYHNRRETPGGPGLLEEQTSGTGCAVFQGHPPACLVAGIPASELVGTHDVAILDINSDGWLDLVVGRCAGTRVFMHSPFEAAGSVSDGTDGEQALRLAKGSHDSLELTWGESCLDGDADYAVYSGQISAGFEDSAPLVCTTSGAAEATLATPAGSVYYLVVAHNGVAEGSYGEDSAGNQRMSSDAACFPQRIATCD